ncbi:MAG: glycosyltransferase [Myxococcota bacterium]
MAGELVWTILFGVSATYWLLLGLALAYTARRVPTFAELPAPRRSQWPTLSLVVPARDEGAHVTEALEARLAEGYPALEVVLVDDRSTDDTGERARALARRDRRVTVTRVDALPEGWLGKVHALERGLAVARGEWLLFSDADVHLAPGTLSRIVAWAEAEGVDHVAAMPSITPGGPGTALSLTCFFRLIIGGGRLWAVADPKSKAAVGVGAFNLFRRSAYARSPGLEWLKMEIGDDMALGVMLKRAGARSRVVIAQEAVSLQFYPSVRVMMKALEKNGATAPLPLSLLGLGLLLALELGWLAGFQSPGWPYALAAWAYATATGLLVARWLRHQAWPALLPGLGMVPLAFVLARSAWLAWRRGGVVWRGTFYPTAAVRAGSRLT